MAHFFYIHFAFPTFFKNVLEGHVAAQYLNTKSRPDVETGSNYSAGGETTLRSEAAYYGPSYMIDYLWHDYHGMTIGGASNFPDCEESSATRLHRKGRGSSGTEIPEVLA